MLAPERLTKRTDYLRVAASGRRWVTGGFMLQAYPPKEAQTPEKAKKPTGVTPTISETSQAGHMDMDQMAGASLELFMGRVGFTVSKKVGNAVMRNRVRRRLKELARLFMRPLMQPGWDYVLVGRAGSQAVAFERLRKDLIWALGKLHADIDLKSPKIEAYRSGKRQKNIQAKKTSKNAPISS